MRQQPVVLTAVSVISILFFGFSCCQQKVDDHKMNDRPVPEQTPEEKKPATTSDQPKTPSADQSKTPVAPKVPVTVAEKNRAQDSWTPDSVQTPSVNPAYGGEPTATPSSVWPPKGKPVRCEFTEDDWLSKMDEEVVTNNGASNRMKFKGQQEFSIFKADMSALKGKTITGALLHVKTASPDSPLYRIGVSTVSSPWKEGTGSGYTKTDGEVSFNQAELGKRDWSYPGSSVLDVVMGRGHTIWKFADCTAPNETGDQAVAVDADVIAANAIGVSYGFFMNDEVGSEWEDVNNAFKWTYYPNRFIFGRDQTNSRPWLEVWVDDEAADTTAPMAIEQSIVETSGYPEGQAMLKWLTPSDAGLGVLGYEATYQLSKDGESTSFPRYLIPMANGEGSECRLHIQDLPFKSAQEIWVTVKPIDRAGNVGPAYTRSVILSDTPRATTFDAATVTPFPRDAALPSVGGIKVGVMDEADKINPVSGQMIPSQDEGYLGGNHLFNASQRRVRLFAGKNEFIAFQLALNGTADAINIRFSFPDASKVSTSLYEAAYVSVGDAGFLPDPMPPVSSAVSIPSKAGVNIVKDQTWHALLCELYVPHTASAGLVEGKLEIDVNGETLVIAVDLTVWNFTLPNKLSFVPEMNSYQSSLYPAVWHQFAHRHRTCINQLPYGWACNIGQPYATLNWDGNGFKWETFDKVAGPMLDGSMFRDEPRSGEPVDVFYLPFNENWPVKLVPNFKPSYWADEGFSPEYRDGMKKAYAAFVKHINEKKWHDTAFEFYLNNKVYNRVSGGRQNRRNVAPWIFDEPCDTKDFWALRWYGMLWRQATDPVRGDAKAVFRGDISYGQHARDMFWGVLDVEVIGGMSKQKVRMKHDEWRLFGDSIATSYGAANKIENANAQPIVWCIETWARGGRRVLPWQTIGTKNTWKTAEQTSVFYPDLSDENKKEPIASIRLKAFRRGQQDIEYLTLLQVHKGLEHFQVANALTDSIDLSSVVIKLFESDAGTVIYKATPEKLWELRIRIGGMLDKMKPPYRRALVDTKVPKNRLDKLPNIGYVPVAPQTPAHTPKADTFGDQ